MISGAATRALLAGIETAVAEVVSIDGSTLDPAIQRLLAARRARGEAGLAVDDDPLATRAHMRESEGEIAAARARFPVRAHDLTIPAPQNPIPARHYRPPGGELAPLLVFYHGGGFVYGDLDLYDSVARQICLEGGMQVLSVDYRLAPEHKAPAAVEDAYTAFRWAAEHADELRARPDRIAVGGDSAGGTLAAVVSQLARDDGGPVPALQWLAYPLTNAEAKTSSRALFANGFLLTGHDLQWFGDEYLAGSGVASADPRVSPMLATSLTGLPPAVLITAGFDPLRDEAIEYAQALRSAGVSVDLREMPSLVHAFMNLGQLGGATTQGISESIQALRKHLPRN